MSGPLALHVVVRTKLGAQEDFKRAAAEVIARSLRREPACLTIELHQNPHDPTEFMLYELWDDGGRYFGEVATRTYLADYFGKIEPLLAEPVRLRCWTPIETR